MNIFYPNVRFQPRLWPALITLVLVAVFVRLGLWQLHKAETKQALQSQLDRHLAEAPVSLPETINDPEAWRYRNIRIQGIYDVRYQLLLDNQVDRGRAGYHVVTPFRIEGRDRYILVNRGWIPALAQHSDIPQIETPVGLIEVTGSLWLPSEKIFALQPPAKSERWQPVWQNLDMKRYMQSVPFKLHPLVVRLDASSTAGGFVRNWPRPAERIETHFGYAYQWFGFAGAAIAIYLFSSFRKVEQ